MSLSVKLQTPTRTPLVTPRKKTILPNIKASSSGNQKLNFTKSPNDLTPRSKALFFSLCKSPQKSLLEPKVANNNKSTVILPTIKTGSMASVGLRLSENSKVIIGANIVGNGEGMPEQTTSLKEFLQGETQKLLIMKLTIKEISDVIKIDTTNSNASSIGDGGVKPSKNYMKDINKYSTLLTSKINPKSPRTRQALANLTYDPDGFNYFSFEEMYNNNMGRVGNVRKYMEYLTSKSNDFLNVLNERNRLVRLERDLNKKFINENVISKNFSDSIFHVNTYKLSEEEMEKLYYNYYCSPESRKRLVISQKKFDTKLLQNRTNFITYQKKLDFVANEVKTKVKEQIKYYKSWEENIKKIEENKEKMLEQKKKLASEYVSKVNQKAKEIKRKETERKHELEKKAHEMAKNLGEELQNRQKNELQKFKEQGFAFWFKIFILFFVIIKG